MQTATIRLFGCVFVLLLVADTAQGFTPLFRDTTCPYFILQFAQDSSSEINCGYLIVPEDREASDSVRLVELFVVRIMARHSSRNAPLIFLSGGPGSPVALRIPYVLASQLSNQYEIIAVDQRGAGFSRPSLNCQELDSGARTADTDWVRDCYRRLRNAEIGVYAYNSANNAYDIRDLLLALEIETANIYGVSYGSRLALTIARDFPEHVRALILDGVYPPHMNRLDEHALNAYHAIERLFISCAAAPDCRRTYPDLRQSFYDVIRSLNQAPVTVATQRNEYELLTSGNDFAISILSKMYDKTLIAYLPAEINAYAHGQYYFSAEAEAMRLGSTITNANRALDNLDQLSEGTWLSFVCADEAPFNSRVEIVNRSADLPVVVRRPLVADALGILSNCMHWTVPRSADIENQPVVSEIPTLLLSGYFDPVTPPHWGDEAKRYLANSRHFVFPDSGHGALFAANAKCAESIALEFLSDPDREPTHDCLKNVEPIAFYLRQAS